MLTSTAALRAAPRSITRRCIHTRPSPHSTPKTLPNRPYQHRYLTFGATSPYALRRRQHFLNSVALVALIGSGAASYQWATGEPIFFKDIHADEPADSRADGKPIEAEIVFETVRKPENASKDETRDQISSQHLQVRKSWENPGVWCWGDNNGNVAAPDSKQGIIRQPRWLSFFEGKLLRDLKLTKTFGAAITEEGDLLQWGRAYSAEETNPVMTLKGKNLKSLVISRDRVFALASSGKVYSMSVSQEEQKLGPKPSEFSWWMPFWSSTSPVSYRLITPSSLGWNERVTQITGGNEHMVLLTSRGRVFSAAASSDSYPSQGQFGIPGLTWFTKPPGAYDTPHEIMGLQGFHISAVAAGDNHTLALDKTGRVFAWGSNERGQLGIGDTSKDTPFFDAPQLLPINKLYAGTQQKPVATSVAAGGNTSFITVDATRVASPNADPDTPASVIRAGLGRVTADLWAAGHGIWGQLGNGRWTHVQATPCKITALSGMFEYDEVRRRAIPIRLRDISVGANHVAATMDNVTYLGASDGTNENDTNWGADVLFFGNNEYYQLGTGKRNNIVTPTYIMPLDREAEVAEGKRPKKEEHRFHATPRSTVRLGNRWVSFEQRVVCGRGVTAVYSGV